MRGWHLKRALDSLKIRARGVSPAGAKTGLPEVNSLIPALSPPHFDPALIYSVLNLSFLWSSVSLVSWVVRPLCFSSLNFAPVHSCGTPRNIQTGAELAER